MKSLILCILVLTVTAQVALPIAESGDCQQAVATYIAQVNNDNSIDQN